MCDNNLKQSKIWFNNKNYDVIDGNVIMVISGYNLLLKQFNQFSIL